MENIYWKKTVGTLISSIWLYTLAGIAASITGAINAFLNPNGVMGMIMNLMNGQSTQEMGIGDLVEKMFLLLVVTGYYLFFRSLTRFMHLQGNETDCENIARIRTGYILMVVALFTDFIPLIGGLVSFILIIISYAKMLSGYSGLKRSVTFPPEAREGASILFTCTIWILVGCVIGSIPLIGSVIESIILLVTFFLILDGWGHIKNGAPDMTPDEEVIFAQDEPLPHKQVLGDGLMVIILIGLMGYVMGYVTFGKILFSSYDYSTDLFSAFLRALWYNWTVIPLIITYIWLLLSPRTQLGLVGKAGLILLILSAIVGLYNFYLQITMSEFSNLEANILYSISNFLPIVGMILFVWGSLASLPIKIVMSLNPLIIIGYWQLLQLFHGAAFDVEFHGQLLLICLLIEVIFFVLICVFVHKWRKEPA